MTDPDSLLHDLHEAAHATLPSPTAAQVDADVTRGRRALHHRRARRIGTRTMLVGVLALGTVAVVHSEGGRPSTVTARPTTQAAPAVRLVAYTGQQPAGYTVSSVPAGWEVQGVNNFTLVIAPVGFKNQRLDVFEGKLVVMLSSVDEKAPTDGVKVAVGSGTGLVSHANPGTPILYFTDAAGHLVVIQQPAALHWSDAQLAEFGAGVHVNANAEQGHG